MVFSAVHGLLAPPLCLRAGRGDLQCAAMARVMVSTLFVRNPDDPLLAPLREAGHDIQVVDGISVRTEDALAGALRGVAATLASTEPYSARVLDQAPDLK